MLPISVGSSNRPSSVSPPCTISKHLLLLLTLNMQRVPFLFLFLLSLLPFSYSESIKQTQSDALQSIVNTWNLPKWSATEDPCTKWKNESENFWVNCSCPSNKRNICDITGLKIYGKNVVGRMPPALFNLTELTYLNLSHNLLSGSIPSNISSLSHLEKLDLSVNNLSDTISQVSNLTKLTYLGLSANMLSGDLKLNLTSLEYLYLDSNQFSGSLELGNLKKLSTLWAFDNNFAGQFPASISSLTNLTDLRIYGTSLEGGIPESLSSLNKLVTLMLGDLGGNDSKLSFLKTMTNLSFLSVRNSNVSGDLSKDLHILNNLRDLKYLDLSYNKLTGAIPSSKDLKSLEHLFLGNNNLQGEFDPQNIPLKLITLDVSFNDIQSNPSPSTGLSINYRGMSNASHGSNYRDKGISSCLSASSCTTDNFNFLNSSFAINCGGEKVPNSGVNFLNDTNPLGAANFSIDSLNQWAVSNVGYSGSAPDVNTKINATDTSMEPLYQTARVSTSSLRYYIGGLMNGSYTIVLHFAEIVINANKDSWESLGRRFFDVFIQNDRVLKDFNIVHEAQGSHKAFNKTFTANVTNGVLDIHLFWGGKGTFGIPHNYTYGPLLSAINVLRNGDGKQAGEPRKRNTKNAGIVTGIAAICIAALLILCSIGYLWWKRINLGHIRLTDSAMKG